jgi:hypothetical protein
VSQGVSGTHGSRCRVPRFRARLECTLPPSNIRDHGDEHQPHSDERNVRWVNLREVVREGHQQWCAKNEVGIGNRPETYGTDSDQSGYQGAHLDIARRSGQSARVGLIHGLFHNEVDMMLAEEDGHHSNVIAGKPHNLRRGQSRKGDGGLECATCGSTRGPFTHGTSRSSRCAAIWTRFGTNWDCFATGRSRGGPSDQ